MQFSTQDPELTLWRGRAKGTFHSPGYAVAPFDRAVLSWNCAGPADFELEVEGVRHCMGRWSGKPRSVKTDAVAVDMLMLKTPARSFRFHVEAGAETELTLVAVAHWNDGGAEVKSKKEKVKSDPAVAGGTVLAGEAGVECPRAWGRALPVPERSQWAEERDAARICSPTSVAMVLEFHGIRKSTREVADGVYDHAARIYGNWPFNTAYAHRASGLETFVSRGVGVGLECLEAEIAFGRPVVISHQWRAGELDGAPLPESAGHLVVVAGFTAEGDVVVNDPAGRAGCVRRVYKRRQIQGTWLGRGRGIMYVFGPQLCPSPSSVSQRAATKTAPMTR